MHKTFLNEKEIQIIKGADKVVKKIGGFPSMENGTLESIFIARTGNDNLLDVELVFDISGWLNTLDFYSKNGVSRPYYQHNRFDERKIKILFHNCYDFEYAGTGRVIGEIKFGGKDQLDPRNRHQDVLPGMDIIIDRPYVCFYIRSGAPIVYFNENECEISAELF